MAIAISLEQYLNSNHFEYDIVKHPYADNSLDTARQAQLEPDKVVKCVMLEDEGGYVMAVCQASKRIQLAFTTPARNASSSRSITSFPSKRMFICTRAPRNQK